MNIHDFLFTFILLRGLWLNDKKLRDENLYFADKYNLFVTAGSDYHGNNKSVKLGDTGCDYKNLNKGLKNFLDTLR